MTLHSKRSLAKRYFISRSSKRADDYDEFWVRYKPLRIAGKRAGRLASLSIWIALLAFVALLVPIYCYVAGNLSLSFIGICLAAWAAVTALCFFINPYFFLRLIYPTHIELSESGLRFHWMRHWLTASAPGINWDRISHVTTTDRRVLKTLDINLEFHVMARGSSFLERMVYVMLSPGMAWGWLTSDRPMLKLNIDGIASSDDRDRLQLALKKYLPSYRIEPKVADDLNMYIKFESYTDLWLDALSTSRGIANKTSLLPGAELSSGSYEVLDAIGSGGQALVYRALLRKAIPDDQGLDGTKRNETLIDMTDLPLTVADNPQVKADASSHVVLKEFVLPAQAGTNVRQRVLENIQKEASLWRRLKHPNIARLIDFFVEDQRAYLVLEDIKGKTLKERVEENGPFSEDKAVDLAISLCDILGYLHRKSPPIVHRDFTPDNLILNDQGALKLIDFNVALQLEAETTKTVAGKHAYIPPEQFRGKAVTQSDLYAFGGTLFFLLTGQEPEAITASNPQKLVPTLSDKLDQLVQRSTEPLVSQRYQDCAEIKQDLIAIKEQKR